MRYPDGGGLSGQQGGRGGGGGWGGGGGVVGGGWGRGGVSRCGCGRRAGSLRMCWSGRSQRGRGVRLAAAVAAWWWRTGPGLERAGRQPVPAERFATTAVR